MKLREFSADHRKRANRNKKQRRRFYRKNHRKCWYCGASLNKKYFRLEHQQPFSKGGSCTFKNIVLSCATCDTEKGNRTVEEYREFKKVERFYGEV